MTSLAAGVAVAAAALGVVALVVATASPRTPLPRRTWTEGASLSVSLAARPDPPPRSATPPQRADLPPPPSPVPVVFHVPTTDPVVFVTIDDGWYATPGALDALRSRNIPATSFLIASPAERAAGYYREIVDLGGTVENHSLTHPQYAKLPRPGQVAEICGNSDRLAATFGRRPLLARPPYGSYNATTNQVFAECGVYANVMWSAEVRQGRLFLDGPGGLQAGDVVLLHYRPETAGDLAVLFAAMDQAGLRAARLQDYLLPKAAQHQRKRHVA